MTKAYPLRCASVRLTDYSSTSIAVERYGKKTVFYNLSGLRHFSSQRLVRWLDSDRLNHSFTVWDDEIVLLFTPKKEAQE